MEATIQARPISTDDAATDYARRVVHGEIVAGPHVRAACKRHLKDLRDGHKRGLQWDASAANRVIGFFRDVLRLSEGQFEGQPFILAPSQCFVVGSLFGWKRKDGTRRFRRAYIEEGKGNGKTPMLAGIGLYGLTADGEPGAQIYSAAAKRDQAMILFTDAVHMTRQSPHLTERLTPSGVNAVWNLADLKTGSFFRPISRESGKSGSGPRPHMALCDEVHEHPERSTMEMLERGFKFRRQPLLLMITNSGSDRKSICWEEHEHAVAVAHGDVEDDTTLSYVCALDDERTITYEFDISICHAVKSCTCNAQITQIELPSPQDFAALVTRERGGNRTLSAGLDAKITPIVRLFLDAFVTLATQDLEKNEIRSMPKRDGHTCGNTAKANGQRSYQENGTLSTGSEKNNKTPDGKQIALESESTAYPASKPLTLNLNRAAAAESAEERQVVSGWITATIQELSGDCYATSAMQELVCSEILNRLFREHSDTCKIRQRFRLESSRLAEDLPADDPLNDPSCWVKANPLLGVIITEDYLADVVSQAKAIPGKLNNILRLHFCVWTDAHTAWITREAWEACEDPDLDISDFEGGQCWAGLDLSATKDLTAKTLIFEDGFTEDGKPKFAAFAHGYTPADTLTERARSDRAPYDVWAREGHITATPGPVVRLDHVAADLVDDSQRFDLQAVAYDRYLIKHFETALDEMGATLPIIEHPQGVGQRRDNPLWMPGSISTLETLILEKRIRFHVNPALRSAVASATFWTSPAGLRRFEKQKATSRIDMAVATTMAIGAATEEVDDGPSVYETAEFYI